VAVPLDRVLLSEESHYESGYPLGSRPHYRQVMLRLDTMRHAQVFMSTVCTLFAKRHAARMSTIAGEEVLPHSWWLEKSAPEVVDSVLLVPRKFLLH